MPVAQHRRFDQGFNQDEASFLLPEGYVYSAKNMLFDKLGITRKRGGIGSLGGSATYSGDHIGALPVDEGGYAYYCFSYRSGSFYTIYAVNTTTGALTSLTTFAYGDANVDGGRPFTHYGFLVWPTIDTLVPSGGGTAGLAVAGGASGVVADRGFTNPLTFTAGNSYVTANVADAPTTFYRAGMIVLAESANVDYVGRITRVVSTTQFEVSPVPPTSFVSSFAFGYNSMPPGNWKGAWNQNKIVSGRIGMSYQGRVLLGNCAYRDIGGTPDRVNLYPRRIWFSSTLLEGDANTGGTSVLTGAVWALAPGFPPLNYFDVPGQDPLTAMAPTGFGDAVIFSGVRAFRLTGQLTTQYGTEQSITWAVREIPNSVGCISERGLQRTTRGLVFPHTSGVYATDGQSMRPLMDRRIAGYWKSLQGTNFKVYGSALIGGNHYYTNGISAAGELWGLLVNLDTLAWTKFAGKVSTPNASWIINSSVVDPANPTRVWALKYGSGTHTGQLVRLDDIFVPSSANRADSDGQTVNFEVVTRPYSEDSPTLQKTWQGATVEYENFGGASVSVTPAFVLDSAELPAGGTATMLPRQDSYTVTGATGANLLIVLTIAAGHNIPQGAWVRVASVGGNTRANGLWRVGAVTGTTLTLLGSIGNGAYTSGGTVTCVDQRDVSLLNAVTTPGANPAAVAYRINDTDLGGAQGADSFELYAITHTWEARDVLEE